MRMFFTGAKWSDGKTRVDLFHTKGEADMNYALMRSLGGPKRIIQGRGNDVEDTTEEGLRGRVEKYLSRKIVDKVA